MNFKIKLPLFFMLSGLSLAVNANEACTVNLHNTNGEVISSFENFEGDAKEVTCQRAHDSCLEQLSEGLLVGRDAAACQSATSLNLATQYRRPAPPSGPGYPRPPQAQFSCTTDLTDRYQRTVRSYTEMGRTSYEACQRTESICHAELRRGHTQGVRCMTRNHRPTPTPPRPPSRPPSRQVSATCRVDRVDRFTGIHISQRYNATHTAYDYNTAKQIACQSAASLCRSDEKIHQMCIVKG